MSRLDVRVRPSIPKIAIPSNNAELEFVAKSVDQVRNGPNRSAGALSRKVVSDEGQDNGLHPMEA